MWLHNIKCKNYNSKTRYSLITEDLTSNWVFFEYLSDDENDFSKENYQNKYFNFWIKLYWSKSSSINSMDKKKIVYLWEFNPNVFSNLDEEKIYFNFSLNEPYLFWQRNKIILIDSFKEKKECYVLATYYTIKKTENIKNIWDILERECWWIKGTKNTSKWYWCLFDIEKWSLDNFSTFAKLHLWLFKLTPYHETTYTTTDDIRIKKVELIETIDLKESDTMKMFILDQKYYQNTYKLDYCDFDIWNYKYSFWEYLYIPNKKTYYYIWWLSEEKKFIDTLNVSSITSDLWVLNKIIFLKNDFYFHFEWENNIYHILHKNKVWKINKIQKIFTNNFNTSKNNVWEIFYQTNIFLNKCNDKIKYLTTKTTMPWNWAFIEYNKSLDATLIKLQENKRFWWVSLYIHESCLWYCQLHLSEIANWNIIPKYYPFFISNNFNNSIRFPKIIIHQLFKPKKWKMYISNINEWISIYLNWDNWRNLTSPISIQYFSNEKRDYACVYNIKGKEWVYWKNFVIEKND